MIGIIGDSRRDGQSSFETLISYCEKDGRAEYIGTQNIHFKELAASEMESLAFKNPRCKDPLMHIILSWREMELPTNRQVDEAAAIALKELDLQDCQAVWIVHADTENRHVHIVANRIDPETHKAIQPAGRWTHKAIQRASRKIELAQGWSIETNGSYQVTEAGELVEKIEKVEKNAGTEKAKLSKTALDVEAHTAAKSAERICQETAAQIIRKAENWNELHAMLADQGIAFERKGSGGVLVVGETVVKSSKAGRDLSLSKLEARLGQYQPRLDDIKLKNRESEPVKRVTESKVTDKWERYIAGRERYFKEKKEAVAELSAHQKIERAELQKRQREEREKLFARSWKGMGTLLNRQRSIIAATQQAAKLDLRDRHNWQREEMRKLFPVRFPNFKSWLETEASPESSISFRYSKNTVIWSAGENNAAAVADLRAFMPIAWNKGGVAYGAKGEMENQSKEAQFVDYGKKIVLSEKCGEEAILAALQLANQKWGGAEINGSEEYKRLCVELAIKHNLKISNPDLAAEVEKGRNARENMTHQKKEGSETENQEKRAIFTRYAEAVGAEKFRITVTEIGEKGTRAFVFDRNNGGYEGKKQEEILDVIPKFSTYSRYGKNIFVTPISADKHHILVDDLESEKLRQLKDDGYSPACVIESSPGNYQAIITVQSLDGDAGKDREAANKLTKDLNQKYGDPKLSGSVHAHRLPPFFNQKPKHQREDGTFPETALIETQGGVCEKARS